MVMAEPTQLQPKYSPVKVGNYDIERTIGKGNFASVKLARHCITKTEVAIKIIEKTRLDQTNLKKIYREINILKLLRHQHIIKLYEVIETSSTIYLVCEYASHGEVFDYIAQNERIPEEKARKMFYQVLTAIEYCHKNNVVHRDLKAENLLLDANDNVKLADFGFGNFFQSGQLLNTWCGSPPYAAPEVFEGKLYEGPQLDIWSLGIVLYVLVCGTFPFDGSSLAKLKDCVLAGRFRIPYWMSQDCENLIRRMLVVNPKKRLTISQIKKHKWMQMFLSKPDVLRNTGSPVRRAGQKQLPEFNEQILTILQSLGFDRKATLESLRNSSYDRYYATYHLLGDRLKHHRTSVPLETKFSYDGGKRRPSSIADESIAEHSTSPSKPPLESLPLVHRNKFFAQQQHFPTRFSDKPVTSSRDDVNRRKDVQFKVEASNGHSTIQRSLAFGAMPVPLVSHPPTSPSETSNHQFMTQTYRTYLPRQTWSFNGRTGAGINQLSRYSKPPLRGTPYRGSGDVTSVASVDEGVELISATPSEQEMIMRRSNQQRRNTLEIPKMTVVPVVAEERSELSRSPIASPPSQADSLFETVNDATSCETNFFCGSMEMRDDVIQSQTSLPNDVTPKVVLSPCLVESTRALAQGQEENGSSYIEEQRQLLDVSPTDFREGRRASDGLLLLGCSRIGDELKRFARANGIPSINQEDPNDQYFDSKERYDKHLFQNDFQNPQLRNSEFGTMTSHSSHHVMHGQRSDVIIFQPYTSAHRRSSLQVTHNIVECTQANPNQQRRGTIPLLFQAQPDYFPPAAEQIMTGLSTSEKARLQPTCASCSVVHQAAGQPSLVQQLQQRKFSRRLKAAQNTMPPIPTYPLPLSQLEQLRINVDSSFE